MMLKMAALLSPTTKINLMPKIPLSLNSMKGVALKHAFCSAVKQVELQEENLGVLCEPCNGTGWMLCDFCNGQKINVKSPTNRIYRRCPTCKASKLFREIVRNLHDTTCFCLFKSTEDLTWTEGD